MTKEAETGNVSAGIGTADSADGFFAVFIQSCHTGGQQFGGWSIQQTALERGVQNTNAQWFGQNQQVAFLTVAVWKNVARVHEAGYAETEFWFRVFDGMAAGNNRTGFCHFIITALQNFAHHFDWQAGWEANQVHGNGRVTAHCVNIAQRVGCCNLTEEVWIVNHWREEVYSLYNAQIVAQFVNKSIVSGIEANDKVWVIEFRELTQNIGKDLRSDFGCSTSTLCHFSQAFAFSHC